MSLIDLKDSIEELEDFSTGVSLPSSIKQWNLKIYEDATRNALLEMRGFRWQGNIRDHETLLRVLSHIFVEMIPNQGVPELYKTLNDINEFYSSNLESENLLLPESRQVKVRYGTRAVRPEFPIVYDEE